MNTMSAQPEHWHVLLAPIATHALPFATLLLVAALVIRRRPPLVLALVLVAAASACVWPTVHFGLAAHDGIKANVDAIGSDWLAIHRRRAEVWEPLFYAVAGLALASLLVPLRLPKLALPLAITTAVLVVGASVAAGYIAAPGRMIRHEELRHVAPPAHEVLRAESDEFLRQH